MKRGETLGALAAFTLLTLVFTWPLARGLASDLPGDFGDPVLNAWIIAWDAGQLGRALAGDTGALGEYWHPQIFAPHPLALAYSEHLTPQALQALPFYLITRNPILGYNLLFLSTFVLSAFFMFLFVRELTGNRAAAVVAGLAFGFAPYRIAAIPHLQVLSSAWMPLTLYFLRRFFDTRRLAPLAWAAASWTAQNLSCGYYLFFFSPVVALYVVWELSTRRLWTDSRILARVAVMTAAVGLMTLPFLLPYLELRQLGFNPRSLMETLKFRADVFSFFTASERLMLWGSLARAFPVPEGELFPGLTIALLAAFALADAWRRARGSGAPGGLERALRVAAGRLCGDRGRAPLRVVDTAARAADHQPVAGCRYRCRDWRRAPGRFAALPRDAGEHRRLADIPVRRRDDPRGPDGSGTGHQRARAGSSRTPRRTRRSTSTCRASTVFACRRVSA